MKPDATAPRGTSRVLHVQNSRGEAAIFQHQGHSRDHIVILTFEEGRPELSKRFPMWSNEAWQLARFLEEQKPGG
jgi:hypothetical protein